MGDIVASREDVTVESTPNVFKALVSAALAEFGDDARVLTMDERFAELVVPGHPVVACNDAASLVIELQMSDRPCIVLPPWGRRAGDLGSFWRGIKMMGMPFAIIIPASGLVQHGLPRGAEHLGVPHLVVEAPAFEPGMPLGIRLALVEIDPTDTAPTTVTRFFKAPDQNDIVLDEVVSDLKQLLRKQGGITEHGFVYRGASLAGQSLRPEDHNPKVAANVADLAEFGQSAVVGDVFEVRRARPMPPEAADALERSAGVRVLRPHEVTLSGEFLPEDVDADEPHPRRFSPVPLQTGD